jgi:hypothetical protein
MSLSYSRYDVRFELKRNRPKIGIKSMEELYSNFNSLSDWVEFPSTAQLETKDDSFELLKPEEEEEHSIMLDTEVTKEESCAAATPANLSLSSTFSTTFSTVSSPKSSCGSKRRRFDGFHVISPDRDHHKRQKVV